MRHLNLGLCYLQTTLPPEISYVTSSQRAQHALLPAPGLATSVEETIRNAIPLFACFRWPDQRKINRIHRNLTDI